MAATLYPPSDLDGSQVLQHAYDEATQTLRVNTQATITAGAFEVAIDQSTDSIKIGDGTDLLAVNADGSINIVGTISLPSGAATAAKQDIGNASLSSIDSKLTSPITVTGPLTDAQLRLTPVPVSVSSLPLPTGASTASNQTSGAQKTQIVDSLNNVISSTSNALDVNIKSGVTIDVQLSEANDSVLVYGFDGSSNQKIKTDVAGSISINDGGNSITIDAVSLPLPTGAATSALQTTGNASLASIDAKLTNPLPISGTVTANAGTGTFAVSAVSLPLPTGAATAANQATEIASLASIDAGIPTALGQTTMANSMPVVLASDQPAITTSGRVTTDGYSSFVPDPSNYPTEQQFLKSDAVSALAVRGPVLTDEGSFRDDFLGTSLTTTLTGTLTFTNLDMTVTGTGTLFTSEVKNGQYLKKTTDSETLYIRISQIISDTELVLEDNYQGTTATTTGHISNFVTTTGSGSFSVLNSVATVASGTAVGTITLYRAADYGPFSIAFKLSISQRIANQTIVAGVQTPIITPTKKAIFQFTGTDNTQVSCISSSGPNAADTQTTSIILPNNLTSTSNIEYAINVSNDQTTFIINGNTVAAHRDHIVGAYDFLNTIFQHTASAIVTTTSINIDWINFYNINQLEIANNFIGEPLVIAPIAVTENKVASYSAATPSFTVAATPTDVFTITGSATRIIKIKKIYFGISATNPTNYNFFLLKRSTANTGGTSASVAAVPNDSDDLAATATVLRYTANPTLGTLVGTVRSYRLTVPQLTPLGGATNGPLNEIYFGDNGEKSIILRGTSEVLSLNFNSVTLAGNVCVMFVEWIEETL